MHSQHQSLAVTRYTIEEGLSDNLINCVLQTRDGFLWVATMNGLNRFDGTHFKIFQHDFSDSLSLSENYIMSLCEDSKGNLWVGTWGGGLCLFNREKENFSRFRHIPSNPNSINDDYVGSIFEDHDGILWIGTTGGGLNRLDPHSIHFKHYFNCNITSICEQKSGVLWLGTWDNGLKQNGLLRFDTKTEMFTSFKHNPNNLLSISSDTVWSVTNEGDSILWLGTYRGVDRFNLRTYTASHFEKNILDGSVIRQVFVDKKNRMWAASFNYRGLFLFEKGNDSKQTSLRLLANNNDKTSLNSDCIRWLYEDYYGNLWIGTQNGLNKIAASKQFFQYTYLPTSYKHTVGNVGALFQDGKNNLWVAYGGGGIDKIDRKTNTRIHFGQNTKSLSDYDITSIYEDKSGTVWIGTRNGGLNKYNSKSNSFTSYLHNSNNVQSIRANWVHEMFETHDGKFLIQTETGTDVFDRGKNTFARLEESLNDSIDGSTIWGNIAIEDKSGNLWFSQWLAGVLYYNVKTKKYTRFMPETNNPRSISSTKTTSMFEDSRKNIWICTYGGGVNKFDSATKTFARYTTRNGLPNDAVFKIEEDNNGFLWMSTMNGLARFNPSNETFRRFDVTDGLINNEFMWRSSFKNSKGEMFFGGEGGFISFFPDSIMDDTRPVKVALTSFKVFERELQLPQSLQTTKEIILKYNQNFFSIEYTALDFADPSHHKYMYILEGFDKQWNNAGDRKFASYTDVHPGTYRFIVKAANGDGLWNNEGLSLSIIVTPAFWMTWWFKLSIILTLIGVVILIYRYRLNNIFTLQRVRLKIAQDLHDEIGSNLSSITITSGLIQQKNNLDNSQKEALNDILITAQETADAMHDIVWFINPDHDNPHDAIVKMKEIAQTLLSNIHYSIEVDEAAFAKITNLETRRNLYFIYKESLNNIVRHAKATHVQIRIERKSNGILLSIADNGIGFDHNGTSNGNGIGNISKRAVEMGAELKIHSSPNKGSEISLLLKIP